MARNSTRGTLNEKGVSLVEALVAIGILATIALFVAQFGTDLRPKTMGIKRVCQSHAQSVINSIQEETYYRQVVNFVPTSLGARTATSFSGGADAGTAMIPAPPPAPPLANMWFTGAPADFVISAQDIPLNGVRLQNHMLIQGTMRSIAVVYNNTNAVRCGFGAYAPLTANAGGQVAWPRELQATTAPSVSLRISPYNRTTGATLCPAPPVPLYAAPTNPFDQMPNTATKPHQSAFAPTLAVNAWQTTINAPGGAAWDSTYDGQEAFDRAPLTPPPNSNIGALRASGLPVNTRIGTRGLVTSPANSDPVSTQIGFEVTVQVNYTDNGVAQSCQVSQKFEYPVDRDKPPAPEVSVIANPSYPDTNGARPNCGAAQPRNATIQISSPITTPTPTDVERGIQWVCRDLSFIKRWSANAGPPYNQPPCFMGTGNPPEPDMQQWDNNNQIFTRRVDQWVPCDQLQQCGNPPTAVRYMRGGAVIANPNNFSNNTRLELDYSGTGMLSADGREACVMNFEVVAVDTAGNTHLNTANPPTNRVFLERNGAPPYEPIRRTPPNGGGDGETRVGYAGQVFGLEILHKRCGTFCPRQQDCTTPAGRNDIGCWHPGHINNYPNGYWTCRTEGSNPDQRAGIPCCQRNPNGTYPHPGCTANN